MLQHAGLIVLYVILFLLNVLIFAGVPGSWISLGAIAIYAGATRFSSIGWKMLLVMAGITAMGEIAESLIGTLYVAGKGATKWGVLGAFVGGLAGAIFGTAIIPVVGSILFGFLGAFAGAVVSEYIYYRSLDRALRTGFFAFIGKLLAMLVKFALAGVVLALFIYRTWP
jgi:hypothetical protein